MIRPALPADTDSILHLAVATELFAPNEVVEVAEMLAASFTDDADPDHLWVVHDEEGVSAVAYVAPEPFGPDVWNLYMLAVDPEQQGGGKGSALVRHAEAAARSRGGRVLLIETSSLDRFERTRAFYTGLGYDLEAQIRDYYAPGDDKVVYWKELAD